VRPARPVHTQGLTARRTNGQWLPGFAGQTGDESAG
jgi:hypothetical protein